MVLELVFASERAETEVCGEWCVCVCVCVGVLRKSSFCLVVWEGGRFVGYLT